MKKKIIALLLTIVCALSCAAFFTACGNTDNKVAGTYEFYKLSYENGDGKKVEYKIGDSMELVGEDYAGCKFTQDLYTLTLNTDYTYSIAVKDPQDLSIEESKGDWFYYNNKPYFGNYLSNDDADDTLFLPFSKISKKGKYLTCETRSITTLTLKCVYLNPEQPEYNRENSPTNGLYYDSYDGLQYACAGIGVCKETDIVIAPIYNGKPVTRIYSRAFQDCTFIKSITIPKSINLDTQTIWAFAGCTSLTSIIYGGPMETWERIILGSSIMMSGLYGLDNCTVYCKDGEIKIADYIRN